MSTMSSRERMLGRLRAAVPDDAAASQADKLALDGRIDAHYAAARTATTVAERVDTLARQMASVRADVWRSAPDAWPALLASRLAQHGVRRVLLDPARAECAALRRALPAEVQSMAFAGPLEGWKEELFNHVDAGFTVARSGIAATGTLILAPDAGTPRSVSLVPPLHVALVYASTLHADLHAALKAENWHGGMPANLVMASGPSKTSDIQQTLAYGAHGPRWMWVIIVMDGAAS
jgi:L-lactate dehydrogenase complex protein LldG